MKFQVAVVLFSLIAVGLAEPLVRSRREVTSWPDSPVNCNDGTSGLVQILTQLGNALDNIIRYIGSIRVHGWLGGQVNLTALWNLLTQLHTAVSICFGLTIQTDAVYATNQNLIASLLGDISAVLDTILGAGAGEECLCTSGGYLSTLITTLLANVQSLLTGIWSVDCVLFSSLLAPILTAIDFILSCLI